MVLPSLYHRFVLGKTPLSKLRKADVLVRNYIRKWLHLPHDSPVAYFHAGGKDGGLGIPSLRWTMPMLRAKRIDGMMTAGGVNWFLRTELDKAQRRATENGVFLNTMTAIYKRFSSLLYKNVDGAGLRDSKRVPQQHQWVSDRSRFLTGADFVNCNRVRINALPTRSRTDRGRRKDSSCRGGCGEPETLNHILQVCHRTHTSRIRRHNAITSYICRNMQKVCGQVTEEPKIQLGQEIRKPDIVAICGKKAILLDAQVVGDSVELRNAHNRKIEYYLPLSDPIKLKYNVNVVEFGSITLNNKRVWSIDSAEDLGAKKFLNIKELKILSTRVLLGGFMGSQKFSATTRAKHSYTSSVRDRAGIGSRSDHGGLTAP